MQILYGRSTVSVSDILDVSCGTIYTALDLFTCNNWIIVSQRWSAGEWFFSFNCFALAVIKFRFILGKFWAGRRWICIRLRLVLLPETIRISPFDKHSPTSHSRRFHWTRWGFREERCSCGNNGQDCSLRGPPWCLLLIFSPPSRRLRRQLFLYRPSYRCVIFWHVAVFMTNKQTAHVLNLGWILCHLVGYTAGSLSVCIRVFPRPAISTQVFLVFLLSSRKCWEDSQVPSCYSKHYTQALPIQFHGI